MFPNLRRPLLSDNGRVLTGFAGFGYHAQSLGSLSLEVAGLAIEPRAHVCGGVFCGKGDLAIDRVEAQVIL